MRVHLVCFLVSLMLGRMNTDQGCGCGTNRHHDQSGQEQYCTKDTNTCADDDDQKLYVSERMVEMPAGEYDLGTTKPLIPADREAPLRTVAVDAFRLDKYEVSNADFAKFVDETEYRTEAEGFGDSFVFGGFLSEERKKEYEGLRSVQALWWYKVPGADWKHPEGQGSSIQDRMEHPVVHVSWNDAKAYCAWRMKGGRLPTEDEWEAACRGGRKDKLYPWGDKLMPQGKHRLNIWQGEFPTENTGEDGYVGTCPTGEFPPNNFGLYNMAGNVWEWTSDAWSKPESVEKVKKGGSYMCHESYCYRYRCGARSQNTADSSAGNLGFRCALDIK